MPRWSNTPYEAPSLQCPPCCPSPSQAHLPSSISGSRSVKGCGDREGAGEVWRGGRNQREEMVRSKVRVRERGQDRPQEHTLPQRNSPFVSDGPQPLGVRGGVCVCTPGAGDVCAAPYPEDGEGHRGRGTRAQSGRWAQGSCVPELTQSSPKGVRRGWEPGGGRAMFLCSTPRSLDTTPAGNDPEHHHVLIVLM